jgi:hypothetical protein
MMDRKVRTTIAAFKPIFFLLAFMFDAKDRIKEKTKRNPK